MVLDFGNADLTSTDFFSIICQILSCADYIANLQEFGFPKIYLNTKVIFHGSYQESLLNENQLGLLPWLYVGLLFLIKTYIHLKFLLVKIHWC